MAGSILKHRNDIECALENAENIGVLMQWIEQAREVVSTFEFLKTTDPAFQKRCVDNKWFSVDWEGVESQALHSLLIMQHGFIKDAVASSMAIRGESENV